MSLFKYFKLLRVISIYVILLVIYLYFTIEIGLVKLVLVRTGGVLADTLLLYDQL